MGNWREDIYSNDTAQDFLYFIKENLYNHALLSELIIYINKNNMADDIESKYVLADFECDFTGNVHNREEILKLIEEEILFLDNNKGSALRINELNKLREKISNKIKIRDDIFIEDWLNEKMDNDIFSTKYKGI